jgi:uncharacterized protein YndB with AHSA1/START domain
MMVKDDDERVVPPDVVYNIFIRTTPQKVWDALTQSAFTTQYFFGRTVESDWQKGSPWKLLFPDGRTDVEGVVLESDPPRLLKVTWRVVWPDDPDPPGPALISYEIQQHGEIVQLTMTQHIERAIPRKYIKAGQMGWGAIFSSLKSLLETGKALDIQMKPPE